MCNLILGIASRSLLPYLFIVLHRNKKNDVFEIVQYYFDRSEHRRFIDISRRTAHRWHSSTTTIIDYCWSNRTMIVFDDHSFRSLTWSSSCNVDDVMPLVAVDVDANRLSDRRFVCRWHHNRRRYHHHSIDMNRSMVDRRIRREGCMPQKGGYKGKMNITLSYQWNETFVDTDYLIIFIVLLIEQNATISIVRDD